MSIAELLRENAAVLLLGGATIGWYAASHVAAEALYTADNDASPARRRALGQWLPTLCVALVAVLLGQSEIAVGVLFGTSVALLSLVLGIVTCSVNPLSSGAGGTPPGGFPVVGTGERRPPLAPLADEAAPAEGQRRLWDFVLPAALLALLAGLSGRLTWLHALVLAAQGLAILFLATDPRHRPRQALTNGSGAPRTSALYRTVELGLAILLGLLASWGGVRAARDMSDQLGLVSAALVSALMLSPALVLPTIGSGMLLAREGTYASAVTSLVTIVLLNLCVGLPLAIAASHVRPLWEQRLDRVASITFAQARAPAPATAAAPDAAPEPGRSLRYPLSVWRVDTVLLIVLGVMLVPLAAGKWVPGRLEGAGLIAIFAAYMWLSTMMART